jgi:peptide deformylase
MAIRQLVLEGDDLLRKTSREVSQLDERLQVLIDDMFQTMYANHGIGLAAVQVGVLRRLFVMDLQDGSGPFVLINPRITEECGSQTAQEGCLSVPGCWGDVERPASLVVHALDRKGESIEIRAEGLQAVCISHETDHLDGILFRDKVQGDLIQR